MVPDKPRATIEEAVDALLSQLATQSQDRLRATRREDLIGLHFGLGMWIRNNLGLWHGNTALLADTGQEHPDGASMVIIEELWERLQAEGSDDD